MLTDLQCKKAKAGEKDYKLADAHGLYLFVTKAGFRSWRWKYRFAGKEKRLVLGSYPEMSLGAAREARGNAARLLKSGVDPSLQARQLAAMRLEEAGTTFEAVAREWHGQQVSGWVPRHAADVLKSLEQDVFPRIGALPIKGITSPMVLEVIRAIEDRPSIETARRVRQRISAVFAYAIASGLADADPAVPIRAALKPLIKGRQPALATLEEARALLRTVEAAPAHPMTKLASRLLALTALRQGVLRTTMWSELEGLDAEAPVWRIPAARMKLKLDRKIDARFDFLLPLSRQAMDVLAAARAFAPYSRLVFPSQRHAHKPISENAVGYLYNRLVSHGRHVPHGWRSTFSTVMNERAQAQGLAGDRAIIDLMLAHIPDGVQASYNRAAYMPRRRELAQEWADLLLKDMPPAIALLEGPRR
jgi:integrase